MDWLFGLVVKPSIPQYFWECPSCQSRYYSEPVQVGLQKGRLVRVPSICPQCFKRCSCGQLKQGEEHCSVCGDARKRITLRRYALSPDDPDFGVTSTGSTTYPTSVQTVNSSASGATWATGYTRATPITMLTSGTVSKVGLNVSSAAGHILIAIYDDLAGAPHNRLAYGSSTSAVSGWNDQTLNVLVFLLIATQYWPAFQNDSASLASYRVSTSTNDFVSSSYGSLPNPFGTPSSNAFGAYMRVTYVQIEGYTKGTQVQYVGPNTGPNAVSDFYFYTHTGAAGDHYIQALFNERGSTRVQFATGHANGGSTIAITLDSNPIDGDALIATVGLLGESVSSISQTGATWTSSCPNLSC